MRFRNQNINHPPPIKPMGEPWNYSVSPIYQNILNCFWDTQRPYEIKEYRNNNPRLRDPFRKINAYKVQQYLNHMNKNPFKEVDWVEDDKGVIRAVIMFYDLHKMNRDTKKVKSTIDVEDMQLSFFQLDDPVLEQIKDELINIDINTLTPVEALMKLNEIKKSVGG